MWKQMYSRSCVRNAGCSNDNCMPKQNCMSLSAQHCALHRGFDLRLTQGCSQTRLCEHDMWIKGGMRCDKNDLTIENIFDCINHLLINVIFRKPCQKCLQIKFITSYDCQLFCRRKIGNTSSKISTFEKGFDRCIRPLTSWAAVQASMRVDPCLQLVCLHLVDWCLVIGSETYQQQNFNNPCDEMLLPEMQVVIRFFVADFEVDLIRQQAKRWAWNGTGWRGRCWILAGKTGVLEDPLCFPQANGAQQETVAKVGIICHGYLQVPWPVPWAVP